MHHLTVGPSLPLSILESKHVTKENSICKLKEMGYSVQNKSLHWISVTSAFFWEYKLKHLGIFTLESLQLRSLPAGAVCINSV